MLRADVAAVRRADVLMVENVDLTCAGVDAAIDTIEGSPSVFVSKEVVMCGNVVAVDDDDGGNVVVREVCVVEVCVVELTQLGFCVSQAQFPGACEQF